MTETDLRNAIRGAFSTLDDEVEAAIRRELADTVDLGHSGRLQFEVCPFALGIHLVQTEEGILEDSAIHDAIPDAIRDNDEIEGDWDEILSEELFSWFAARWQAVGGPERYSPAYAYYHGGLHEPRYHLEERRWCEVEEVWPE